MHTAKEIRFKKFWEEQRHGGKMKYILLYTFVGTFMLSLIISVLLLLFYNFYPGTAAFWIVPVTALLISFIYSLVTWQRNEAKWKKISHSNIGK